VPLDVLLESGKRRSFAVALDWPGWARSGKGDDDALTTLLDYRPRYDEVVTAAGLRLPGPRTEVRVVEQLPGTATTEFGVPDRVAEADTRPVSAAEGRRQAALLAAAWDLLDRVAATAPPVLRKGPRGGGRDRDAIVAHVVGAEVAYDRRLGLRIPAPDPEERAAVEAARAALLEVVRRSSDGTPTTAKGWPLRYAVRRATWHVLDHAWEIQDRSDP
jgi:hypothetical protein